MKLAEALSIRRPGGRVPVSRKKGVSNNQLLRMPRRERQTSGTGIYHVMMRGIIHQNIFEDQEDYYQFLSNR